VYDRIVIGIFQYNCAGSRRRRGRCLIHSKRRVDVIVDVDVVVLDVDFSYSVIVR
jgi:hypothetical protein